jgi:type I restriction enzyme, R subunit
VIQTALVNPLDKFQLGIRKFIEEFMVQRMGENEKIVTRYMDDPEFQNAAFPILAKAIFAAVREKEIASPESPVE